MLALLIIACGEVEKESEPSTEEGNILVDQDGDGYLSDEDCDDSDGSIFPDAEEICDGFDNNCNGQADEGVTVTYFADSDSDGFGSPNITTDSCTQPDGYAVTGTDCDDTDAQTYPGAIEICDEKDNSCDELIDEGLEQTFYQDLDGDGFGDDNVVIEACDLRIGLSAVGGDCDDSDIDISPLAIEDCDELDNNCNGEIDEGATQIYYLDFDEDGYGDENQIIEGCSLPEGYVEQAGDCLDNDTFVYPNSIEICDEIDNDCDGTIDEDILFGPIYYEDGDEDGFGDAESTITACSPPSGYVENSDDCDDQDDDINPNGLELCNNIDEDCDGILNNDPTDAPIWYIDNDGDDYGQATTAIFSCEQPDGYVSDNTDCDDQDNDIYPTAVEICNNQSEDCDEDIDEDAVDGSIYFIDNDGDGFGSEADEGSIVACIQPENYVTNNFDCDDSLETGIGISPTQSEICDGVDNNCNEEIDEQGGEEVLIWYLDADGDTFGDVTQPLAACGEPQGYVANFDDCDDDDENVFVGAEEICDEIDNDCDGTIDGEDATDALVFYLDTDGDGFGIMEQRYCTKPDGYSEVDGDCDDQDNDIYPNAVEFCNDEDDDCDDLVDETPDEDILSPAVDILTLYVDADGDGFGRNETVYACEITDDFVTNNLDCDDNELDENSDDIADGFFQNPDSDEFCDDVDSNCNGEIDDSPIDGEIWYADTDEDLAGDPNNLLIACSQPDGYVEFNDDCDDSTALRTPGNIEICDGIDNNCENGTDDERNGSDISCAAASCQAILDEDPSSIDGVYWLDPDEDGDTSDAWEAYCDMTRDGGGWTKVESALWPFFFSHSNWNEYGNPTDDNYSKISEVYDLAVNGVYTFRYEVGGSYTYTASNQWITDTDNRSHYTIWSQEHNPAYETSDGSDYIFIDGEESTTCGGFNGMHSRYYEENGTYTVVTDVDSSDGVGCWWHQILPLANYNSLGYLEGYGGTSQYHGWHSFWIR